MATQTNEDASRASWLPRTRAPLVPRDRELSRVVDLIERRDTSLLTLVGPPGAGKTTLALMAAEAVTDVFRDGVSFVDLSATRDPALVPQTVAAALGIADASGEDILATLKRVLRDRSAMLILDNFEQVLPAATMIRTLLDGCPQLKVLVTSRVALQLSFEQRCLVPPLSVPDLAAPLLPELVEHSAAVALFTLRARAVNQTWELTLEEAAPVAEVCARLDGLPLAIELAASWMGILTATAMLGQLRHALDLLVSRQRDWPERHQTLRAAIRWSEDLLAPELQTLFRRLGVFSGGWTLDAAAAVCGDMGSQPGELLQGLGRLANHHLVVSHNQPGGETRFGMLATIHDYALERLGESRELDAIRRRHAAYYLGLVRAAERAYHSPEQGAWLDRLEAEYDNLRAVLDWCAGSTDPDLAELGMELAAALWFFWTVRGHIREGRERLQALLNRPGARVRSAARARALTAAGWLAWFNSDASAAFGPLEESLSLHRELGDEPGAARALAVIGLCLAVYTDELARARQVLEEASALSQATAEPWAMGFSVYGLGHLAARQEDNEQALLSFQRSLAIRKAGGNRWGVAYSLYRLSLLALARGDLARATELQYQSLSISWELRNKRGMATSAEVLACLAGIQGRADRAARLFGVTRALLDAANYVLTPTLAPLHARGESAARAELGPRMFMKAWNEGRSMPLADGIALALAEYGISSGRQNLTAVRGTDARLSPREWEIVRLVSLGLTDRQIGDELGISARTVDGHLRRIFAKVGVQSRAALTAWAMQEGLGRGELARSAGLQPALHGAPWQPLVQSVEPQRGDVRHASAGKKRNRRQRAPEKSAQRSLA